jgi:hypothetical protein
MTDAVEQDMTETGAVGYGSAFRRLEENKKSGPEQEAARREALELIAKYKRIGKFHIAGCSAMWVIAIVQMYDTSCNKDVYFATGIMSIVFVTTFTMMHIRYQFASPVMIVYYYARRYRVITIWAGMGFYIAIMVTIFMLFKDGRCSDSSVIYIAYCVVSIAVLITPNLVMLWWAIKRMRDDCREYRDAGSDIDTQEQSAQSSVV